LRFGCHEPPMQVTTRLLLLCPGFTMKIVKNPQKVMVWDPSAGWGGRGVLEFPKPGEMTYSITYRQRTAECKFLQKLVVSMPTKMQ
jgi:hypothetical protein